VNSARARKAGFACRLATCYRLGLGNVFAVICYRLLKKVGYYRFRLPVSVGLEGPFLTSLCARPGDRFSVCYFGRHEIEVISPPDWFCNPWTGERYSDNFRHWSEVADFITGLGDIKTVWELSRFDWLPRMAWRYRQGDKELLEVMELWLRDWCRKNPPNAGINWKCGQEVGLRCLNLLVALLAIDDSFIYPRPGILRFLAAHLERIVPTLKYAMAQDNNHGISEAAALYAAGYYLVLRGADRNWQDKGRRLASLGQAWLENRVAKLILADGSFSQYSLTYHRMVVDELSFVELFRRRCDLPAFSERFYARARAAVEWLGRMVDPLSGDGPNLGPNDGTHLFNLDGSPYRDFRGSWQLGSAVFMGKFVDRQGVVHPLLELFALNPAGLPRVDPPDSALMPDGGYACIRHTDGFALLRLPVCRFRPSHADGLHLDIWHEGVNWARDAGSFSYNADTDSMRYFPGTAAHNTVAFDGRDQMPRLGRFLYGTWLKPEHIAFIEDSMSASYRDIFGARHKRKVKWEGSRWVVTDEMSGFSDEAVISWHLPDIDWYLGKQILYCDRLTIEVRATKGVELSLETMPESRHYLEKKLVPVLRISCQAPDMKVESIFNFKP